MMIGSLGHASLGWFGRHELRLAWRDALLMLQGGRRRRRIGVIIGVVAFVGLLHAVAYAVLKPASAQLAHPDKAFLLTLTGSVCFAWLLLMSQAMETVTRSFYARADLDLILSSPAPARRLFAIRIIGNAIATVAMAAFLIGPAINVAAFLLGPRFLLGYGVLAAMGCSALAAATAGTALMFRVIGPRRTRLLAQIVAAVVGAGFVIGVQVIGINAYGSLSRTMMFQSPAWVAAAPDVGSPVWWVARAALGDSGALSALLAGAIALLVAAIAFTAPAFAQNAMTVAGLATERASKEARPSAFRRRSRAGALRAKELVLLWRDPWLVSQSLMQVLYLVPPALLLWRDFGTTDAGRLIMLVPIFVMAAGQLAGGLAWLAISGEDAPDLVKTAPIAPRAILKAKIEAVLIAVAVPILPIAALMAIMAPYLALVTLGGAIVATAGASTIQFIFRSQAKRSNFRRRQTSSRLATLAEAFLSISIAAAFGLAAARLWLPMFVSALIAVGVLAACRFVAGPAPTSARTS